MNSNIQYCAVLKQVVDGRTQLIPGHPAARLQLIQAHPHLSVAGPAIGANQWWNF